VLAVYDGVSRDLGFDSVVAVDPMRAGAADVSFTATSVSSALDALGLAGWDDHTDKETANLNWFPRQTKRAAVLLYRLSNSAAGQ
jgi:glutamate carboxypeptidase